MSKTFTQKVAEIQKNLKAPKSQRNKFGNYNYRNQEDILEAVKPLLGELVLTVNDEIVEVGGRVYVKATATIRDSEGGVLTNSAFAREPAEQKGMSDSQITGAASSYARKYCLNGLFLIDDTKDADSDEVTAITKGLTTSTPAATAKAVTNGPSIPSDVAKDIVEDMAAMKAANVKVATKFPRPPKKDEPKKSGDMF